ncbi:hypothetical protein ACFLWH_00400 [Chloroflexota bacterium]
MVSLLYANWQIYVASWMGGQEILTKQILSIDEITSIVDAITVEELKQLAQEVFVGSQLRMAIVGPITNDDSLDKLLKF